MTSANDLTKNIKRVIFTEEEIKAKIAEAGRELSEKYAGKPLLLVSILNGSVRIHGGLLPRGDDSVRDSVHVRKELL